MCAPVCINVPLITVTSNARSLPSWHQRRHAYMQSCQSAMTAHFHRRILMDDTAAQQHQFQLQSMTTWMPAACANSSAFAPFDAVTLLADCCAWILDDNQHKLFLCKSKQTFCHQFILDWSMLLDTSMTVHDNDWSTAGHTLRIYPISFMLPPIMLSSYDTNELMNLGQDQYRICWLQCSGELPIQPILVISMHIDVFGCHITTFKASPNPNS